MADKVYKKVRVTGCSSEGYDKAIEAAVRKASESLRGLAWWEVTELRGAVLKDGTLEWQATLDVGFKLD